MGLGALFSGLIRGGVKPAVPRTGKLTTPMSPQAKLKFAGTKGYATRGGGGGTAGGSVGPANHESGAGNSRASHGHTAPLDRLWGAEARWNLAERALGTLKDVVLPTAVHAISVSVVGGPAADLRRVWYLALAASFGRYRRSTIRGAYSLQIKAVWDITGKAAGITLAYATTTIGDQALSSAAALLPALRVGTAGALAGLALVAEGGRITDGVAQLFQRGPDQWTQGGDWPNALLTPEQLLSRITGSARGPAVEHTAWAVTDGADVRTTRYRAFTGPNETGMIDREVAGGADNPGVPYPKLPYSKVNPDSTAGNNTAETDLTADDPPQLPDYNRIITTGYKMDPAVQPPRPPGDGLSRGSLVQLVTAALGRSGEWPVAVEGNLPVIGSSGRWVGETAPTVPTEAEVNPLTESADGLLLPNGPGTVVPRVIR